MTESINAHVNKMDGWMIAKTKMLEMKLGTLQTLNGDNKITVPMVAGYKNVDKDLSALYYGAADGAHVDGDGWIPPATYDPRSRPWYAETVRKGSLSINDPYLDVQTNKMAVSVGVPMMNASGQLKGVLAVDFFLETLVDTVKNITINGNGYAYLIDNKGIILAHPNPELVNANFLTDPKLKDLAEQAKTMLGKDQGFINYRLNNTDIIMIHQKIPSTGWVLAICVPEEVVNKPLVTLRWMFIGITIVAILLIVLVTFFTAKRIVQPVEELAAQVNVVSDGNLTVQAVIRGKDEVADLARGFNKMVHNLRNLIVEVNGSAEQVAASSEQLTASAQESAEASTQVAGSISHIAMGADQQLSAIENTVAVVHKISGNIQQMAVDANHVVEKTSQAAGKAKVSDQSINKAVSQMGLIEETVNTSANLVANLGERSKEIGQIVETIAGIAGQTNLLALNAAIEAARAGEQGRGFAVVADEVRKLAEQSEDAAKQIATLIGEIQRETAKAVTAMSSGTREVSLGAQAVKDAGRSFKEIDEIVTQVAEQIMEISDAMQQMEIGSQQIVSSVHRINDLSKQSAVEAESVSAATEQQSASIHEVACASKNMAKMAQNLQETVRFFQT
ncbi:methyl-accepting chemotaxis protein [Pelosinus propionicus]|nr:methyl-accepting chemotaxis protein [Pelosinus propionicus]